MLSAATLSNPRPVGTDFEFSVTGASNAIYAVETSSDLRNWTRVATNREFGEVRTIRMASSAQQEFYRVRPLQPLFTGALAVRESVELFGSGVTVISFDSHDPSFFHPDGTLDLNRFRDRGDIITSSAQTNSLIIGNGKVYGKLRAPVDGGAVLGPNGCVGSILWHLNGGQGIQPGYLVEETSRVFVDAELPSGHVYVTPEAGSIDGTNYTYVLSNGHYSLSELRMGSSNHVMLVTGRATLHVSGLFTVTQSAKILIGRDASLDLYVGGSAGISLSSVVNQNRAAAFVYYGLPGNTNVSVQGNGLFTGAIYAPAAAVIIGGGGNDELEIRGALVGRNIKVNAKLILRYDEALGVAGPVW